jgi:hypothetical protein
LGVAYVFVPLLQIYFSTTTKIVGRTTNQGSQQ